ncbi:hypothetical protein D3Y59_01685 [Hymenobacter oligotrophus]|uniref:Glycosyltransferase RgtA/B/C/D-like domain-containing protein n=1 Tax=Hymenobacter oligotrophus TaxID=2319843 RepID=A0A3B7R2L2_9BACT|nr:hypothetical protein D3Y59_01685 [Hymenobacter oligotrophus]
MLLPLLLDLGYSYVQHLNVPHDGDMASHVLPRENIRWVLQDPFALKVLLENQYYSGPNRYFAFATLYHYMRNVPLWLQAFVDPIYSTYMACAMAKTFVQALLIALLAYYASERFAPTARGLLIAALLCTPFFQTAGFHDDIGIIDRSITYTIFYALPLGMLLVYFLPFYRQFLAVRRTPVSAVWQVVLPFLAVVLALHGPLIPAVAGLLSSALLSYLWLSRFRELRGAGQALAASAWQAVKAMPWGVVAQFGFLILLCAYSLYIGTHNAENVTTYTLAQRYEKLWQGIPNVLGNSWAFPLLLLAALLNVVLVAVRFRTRHDAGAGRILKAAQWLLALSVLYLVLLPLGGYREVRPFIMRRDTIMPVTLCLVYLFATSGLYLLYRLPNKLKFGYLTLVVALAWFYSAHDRSNLLENNCEVAAMRTIAASPEPTVHLEADCSIMNWGTITDPRFSEEQGKMLHYWNITRVEKRFYH